MKNLGIEDGLPVPKYYRLKESLRHMIEDEEFAEGQIVPSERELCEHYGVSRMTARQAVLDLVNEGLLYREQGRGTFVAGRKLQHETAKLTSFTQDMRNRRMEVSSTLLGIEVEDAGPMVARRLRVEPSESIIHLRRVRNADGEPMALESCHLLYDVGKVLLETTLETFSLYEELRKSGLRISRAEQSYEATLVDDAEVEYLSVPSGSAALLIERVTFDDEDRPFEYVKSIYRADRYRVSTVLHP